MGKIITAVRNLKAVFRPREAKDPYVFIAQQFGHICISALFCFMIPQEIFGVDLYGVNISIVLTFWVFWELNQLKRSNNEVDFIEDLIFETLGVLAYAFIAAGCFNRVVVLVYLCILLIYASYKYKLYKTDQK